MKSKLFFIAMLAIIGKSADAQNYYTLPTSNFGWQIQTSIWVTSTGGGWTTYSYDNYFTNSLNPDTIINSITYTKIYCDSLSRYNCAFRSDTTGKTFLVPHDSTNEYLVMDISKNAGDTIKNVLCYCAGLTPIIDICIDSVDYLKAGPYTLKKLYLSNHHYWGNIWDYTQLFWIEKIGTSTGFSNEVYYLGGMMGSNEWESLYCMQYNDTIYFNSGSGPVYGHGECYSLADINNNSTYSGIKIFPNPTNGILIIDQVLQNTILSLSDIQGRLLYWKSLEEGKSEIDLSKFENGVYLLRLRSNNKTAVTKVVKE